ncbi:MAG: NUDIX domain-containing protein [Dehalococcoidia bacterium]
MTHGATAADVIERHHTATAYVVAEGRTLLMWHEKLRMWLPPGGHCELNEDPVQAALREAYEETGIRTAIIPPSDLLVCGGPSVLPPPVVILVEDIVRHDQPFHQHIDHVYFTRPLEPVDLAAPIPSEHPWRWLSAEDLAEAFSLAAADGTLVPVAEDVRLLGIRAIVAEGAPEPAHA